MAFEPPKETASIPFQPEIEGHTFGPRVTGEMLPKWIGKRVRVMGRVRDPGTIITLDNVAVSVEPAIAVDCVNEFVEGIWTVADGNRLIQGGEEQRLGTQIDAAFGVQVIKAMHETPLAGKMFFGYPDEAQGV